MSETSAGGSALPSATIVYHYFALYRLPVLRVLVNDFAAAGQELRLIASATTNVPSIRLIEPELATRSVSEGGLCWEFVHNIWIGRNVLWQVGLLRKLLTNRSDVIVFLGNPYYLTTWIAAAIARVRGKRVLFWTHGVTRSEHGIRRVLRKIFYRLPHGLLLYSHWAKDHLVAHYGLRAKNLYVVFNSLDYDTQVKVRKNLTKSRIGKIKADLFPDSVSRPVLVYVGRVTRRKQLSLLLYAAKSLAANSFPVNVLIVGDGPDLDRLKIEAEQLGLEDVVCFRGSCYDEDELGALLSTSDLCVVPDSAGLSVIHALGYGTPVATHSDQDMHGPEFEAISPGENGILFERGSEEDLARKIRGWIESHPDREGVRQACYKVVERFYNPHVQSSIIRSAVEGKISDLQ